MIVESDSFRIIPQSSLKTRISYQMEAIPYTVTNYAMHCEFLLFRQDFEAIVESDSF